MPAAALAPTAVAYPPRGAAPAGTALTVARASAEQAWNSRQLAAPITVPRVRVWTYPAPGVVFGCAQAALHGEAAQAARTDCELVQRRAGGGVERGVLRQGRQGTQAGGKDGGTDQETLHGSGFSGG